jgi:hypothetical protein
MDFKTAIKLLNSTPQPASAAAVSQPVFLGSVIKRPSVKHLPPVDGKAEPIKVVVRCRCTHYANSDKCCYMWLICTFRPISEEEEGYPTAVTFPSHNTLIVDSGTREQVRLGQFLLLISHQILVGWRWPLGTTYQLRIR